MALYDVVNGVYRKVAKKYDPVGGVYRNVKAAYDPVDGVYRKYFGGGAILASELAVGDSVWLNVDGTLTEFLVVQQGKPAGDMYDATSDGTWLLMKDIYELSSSNTANNFYEHLDSRVQSAIKTASLKKATYNSLLKDAVLMSISANTFSLSGDEVGFDLTPNARDGSKLEYFRTHSRIAYYNGTATSWWLRSEGTSAATKTRAVSATGTVTSGSTSTGVRPAFILDSNTPVNQSNGINIIA